MDDRLAAIEAEHLRRLRKIRRTEILMYATIAVVGVGAIFAPLIAAWLR